MRIYLLSPDGVPVNPHLFPMFISTWEENNCAIVDRIEDCDVVLFDLHSRLSGYKQDDIDWVLQNNPPIAIFDEWDRGNMSNDQWPYPLTKQQEQLWLYSHTAKSVHFCRLLDKTKTYPTNLYPYEKPILHEEPILTSDELFNRQFDAVFIANYSPSRMQIAEALQQEHRLKTFISIGAKKREFDDFLNWHKRGKLFINSSAGGYTCERPQRLFSISGMIRQRTDQLLANPFTHLENCIEIDCPPTAEQLNIIFEISNDKERLYEVYKNGVEFTKKYYSSKYIAEDILSKIIKHLC